MEWVGALAALRAAWAGDHGGGPPARLTQPGSEWEKSGGKRGGRLRKEGKGWRWAFWAVFTLQIQDRTAFWDVFYFFFAFLFKETNSKPARIHDQESNGASRSGRSSLWWHEAESSLRAPCSSCFSLSVWKEDNISGFPGLCQGNWTGFGLRVGTEDLVFVSLPLAVEAAMGPGFDGESASLATVDPDDALWGGVQVCHASLNCTIL